MASTIAGCGVLMRMMAVCASGVSTFSTGPSIVVKGWFALIAMMENATSSEVMGLPSWNTAPRRRFSVSDLPSGASDQLSARYGCAFHLSSKRSGLAKSWVDGSAVAMPDCTAPLRWRGDCVLPKTSVPPRLGSSAAAGQAMAAARRAIAASARRRAKGRETGIEGLLNNVAPTIGRRRRTP